MILTPHISIRNSEELARIMLELQRLVPILQFSIFGTTYPLCLCTSGVMFIQSAEENERYPYLDEETRKTFEKICNEQVDFYH